MDTPLFQSSNAYTSAPKPLADPADSPNNDKPSPSFHLANEGEPALNLMGEIEEWLPADPLKPSAASVGESSFSTAVNNAPPPIEIPDSPVKKAKAKPRRKRASPKPRSRKQPSKKAKGKPKPKPMESEPEPGEVDEEEVAAAAAAASTVGLSKYLAAKSQQQVDSMKQTSQQLPSIAASSSSSPPAAAASSSSATAAAAAAASSSSGNVQLVPVHIPYSTTVKVNDRNVYKAFVRGRATERGLRVVDCVIPTTPVGLIDHPNFPQVAALAETIAPGAWDKMRHHRGMKKQIKQLARMLKPTVAAAGRDYRAPPPPLTCEMTNDPTQPLLPAEVLFATHLHLAALRSVLGQDKLVVHHYTFAQGAPYSVTSTTAGILCLAPEGFPPELCQGVRSVRPLTFATIFGYPKPTQEEIVMNALSLASGNYGQWFGDALDPDVDPDSDPDSDEENTDLEDWDDE